MSDSLLRFLGPEIPLSRAVAVLAAPVIADTAFIGELREALHSLWALVAFSQRREDLGRAGALCEEIARLIAIVGRARADRLARRWASEWAGATGIRPFGFGSHQRSTPA